MAKQVQWWLSAANLRCYRTTDVVVRCCGPWHMTHCLLWLSLSTCEVLLSHMMGEHGSQAEAA